MHRRLECKLHATLFRQKTKAKAGAWVASFVLSRFLHLCWHSPRCVAFTRAMFSWNRTSVFWPTEPFLPRQQRPARQQTRHRRTLRRVTLPMCSTAKPERPSGNTLPPWTRPARACKSCPWAASSISLPVTRRCPTWTARSSTSTPFPPACSRGRRRGSTGWSGTATSLRRSVECSRLLRGREVIL